MKKTARVHLTRNQSPARPCPQAFPLFDSSAPKAHLSASAELLVRPLDLPVSAQMHGRVLDEDKMGYTLLLP